MSTHTYARKVYDGSYASPTQGDPTLNELIEAALPGKYFVVRCSGADLSVVFDVVLTPGEVALLDQAYTDWTPGSRNKYLPIVRVETPVNGRIAQVDWYEDAALTKLAKREVRNFQGYRWLSTVITEFYTDGAVASTTTETYTTLANGKIVTEVS